ncbi:hypothetical protein GAGA_0749 [Paraglaciecola agarilytica NO2]|uniref:Uncharacterized protein n=1 Tax=Paraglaciecola agarilytica NO2 TaxID=1125747 RepID=A0ABQ0I2T0_9ALTE|nr:hypothetical protein GAGA_0749 [Paraglaciecola agarilytica NO2]
MASQQLLTGHFGIWRLSLCHWISQRNASHWLMAWDMKEYVEITIT